MDETPSDYDITQWMSGNTARAFHSLCKRRFYKAGQVIYMQGDPGREMFRVISGTARMSVAHVDGRELVFTFIEPGGCFGDSSLVDDGARPQTTQALTDMEVEVIGLTDFNQLRLHHADFNDALLRLLARQMRNLSERYTSSSLSDLNARVARRILDAAMSIGSEVEEGLRMTVRLSRAEIASMAGASRQSVNRMMQRMQESGLIRIEYGNLLIRDIVGLEHVACER